MKPARITREQNSRSMSSTPQPRSVDAIGFEMWLGSLSTPRGLSIPVVRLWVPL